MRRIHSSLTGARVACGNVIVIDIALTLFFNMGRIAALTALILLMTWPLGGKTPEACEMAIVMKDLNLDAIVANVALCILELCCIKAARFLCWAEGAVKSLLDIYCWFAGLANELAE